MIVPESFDAERTVTTQAELDAALAHGVQYIKINSPRGVWLSVTGNGSSSVVARESSRVEARDRPASRRGDRPAAERVIFERMRMERA